MSSKPTESTSSRAGSFPSIEYRQQIRVPFEYPVYFTRRAIHPRNALLADVIDRLGEGRRHRALVYVDQGVADAHPLLLRQIAEYFHLRPERLELAAPPAVVPGGEQAKNSWDTVRDILWTAGNAHLDRQSFILAIGGGSMLDMVGFAASTLHRGVRLVRLPSTTLAQNDAGVGVKNGMNEHGQKNFIGTFAPPFAVINDASLLTTLRDVDWRAGVAEAMKVALIADASLFDFLRSRAEDLRNRDLPAMEECVRRCAILHLDHIREHGDPFEFGSARPLDFGHWAGHRIEALSGYRTGHGQAVSVGIALDSYYAFRQGLLSRCELDEIVDTLRRCGLPVWSPCLRTELGDGTPAVLEGLQQFREHLGGRLTITLPRGIGRKVEVHEMNHQHILDGIDWLEPRATATDRQDRT